MNGSNGTSDVSKQVAMINFINLIRMLFWEVNL